MKNFITKKNKYFYIIIFIIIILIIILIIFFLNQKKHIESFDLMQKKIKEAVDSLKNRKNREYCILYRNHNNRKITINATYYYNLDYDNNNPDHIYIDTNNSLYVLIGEDNTKTPIKYSYKSGKNNHDYYPIYLEKNNDEYNLYFTRNNTKYYITEYSSSNTDKSFTFQKIDCES